MPTDSDADRLVCQCCSYTCRFDAMCIKCNHLWDERCERHGAMMERAYFAQEMYELTPEELKERINQGVYK